MPVSTNDPTADLVAVAANVAGEMELGARWLAQRPLVLLCAVAAVGFLATLSAKRPRRHRLPGR